MSLIDRARDRIARPSVEKLKAETQQSIAELVKGGSLIVNPNDPAMLEIAKDAYQGMPAPWSFSPAGVPAGIQRYQFDYNHQGTQMRRKPMSNVSFQILREFSTTYEVARAAINARKRQITSLEWEIIPLDQGDALANKANAEKYKTEINAVSEFFDNIGGHNLRFRNLLDMIIEDTLVLDAVALLRQKSKGDHLLNLTPLDAATIKLVVDQFGNTPEPPQPAYMQVIRGAVTAELTTDQMIYAMMNPRSSTPYGLAPIESLIIVISSALRSNLVNLNYLTDGNIPEGLFAVPQDWSPSQIKEYQEVWDAYLAGDPRATSRLRFVPGGPGVGYHQTKKIEEMQFKEFQQWLMLCTCAMFDIQPQELGFTLHHSTKANAHEQSNIQMRRGVLPLTNFIREIFRDIIQKDLGFDYLDFKFVGIEDRDELAESQARQARIQSGFTTVDEERREEGKDPLGVDEPYVLGQPIFLKPELELEQSEAANPQPEVDAAGQPSTQARTDNNTNKPDGKGGTTNADPASDNSSTNNAPTRDAGNSTNQKAIAISDELRKMQTYAVTRKAEGKSLRAFESNVIEKNDLDLLNAEIAEAKSEGSIKEIIRNYRKTIDLDKRIAAEELKNTLEKIFDKRPSDAVSAK